MFNVVPSSRHQLFNRGDSVLGWNGRCACTLWDIRENRVFLLMLSHGWRQHQSQTEPANAEEATIHNATSFSSIVPLKKSGFIPPKNETGLSKTKSRKSASVIMSFSTSS